MTGTPVQSMPAAARRAALALACAAVLGGCSRPAPLLAPSGPTEFASFEVRDAGDGILWRIEAEEPAAVEALVYGSPPPGFHQVVPADGGAPRAFTAGERLVTESRTRLRRFRHFGVANGPGTFAITDSEVRLLRLPPPDTLAATRAKWADLLNRPDPETDSKRP